MIIAHLRFGAFSQVTGAMGSTDPEAVPREGAPARGSRVRNASFGTGAVPSISRSQLFKP